jgi:hypothetical protein
MYQAVVPVSSHPNPSSLDSHICGPIDTSIPPLQTQPCSQAPATHLHLLITRRNTPTHVTAAATKAYPAYSTTATNAHSANCCCQ